MLKKFRRLLRMRNNSGFTLVEVIVASALLGILMLGVMGFAQPVLKSVKSKENNARAVMLAESVESFISNSTRYAYYIQTFSGVTDDDVSSPSPTTNAPVMTKKYSGTEFPDQTDVSLELLYDCLNNVLGTANYEVRCLGIRWLKDPKTGEYKQMLTQEVVDQSTGVIDLTKTKLVFEPCYYDELYPVFRVGNYNNQYKILDASGALVDKYDPADVKMAPGLELTMDVYLDNACYSTNDAVRKSVSQTFTGTTYTDYRNISSVMTINKTGAYKINANIEVNNYLDALTGSAAKVYNDPTVGASYCPDTYIYYLARKTKTSGGAGGGTPTPPTPPATP